MRRNALGIVIIVLLGLDILLRLTANTADAQTARPPRKPIALTVAPTNGGNYLVYRMWDDGLIDVKLSNPPRDNLTFQEGWRIYQQPVD